MSIPGLLEAGLGGIGLAWAPLDRENSRGHVLTCFVPVQNWAVADRTELKTGKWACLLHTALTWIGLLSVRVPVSLVNREGSPLSLGKSTAIVSWTPGAATIAGVTVPDAGSEQRVWVWSLHR